MTSLLLALMLMQQPTPISGKALIQVTATDATPDPSDFESGVAWVELYADGVLIKRISAAPYNFDWDTRSLPDGAHTLTAKAADAAGNVGNSPAFPVDVRNLPTDKTPPAVTIVAVSVASLLVNGTQVAEAKIGDPLKYVLLVPRMTPPRDTMWNIEMRLK